MNEEIEILRIKRYEKFKCIADKCKFTCCTGWDISVDSDTYNKWKGEDNSEYLLDNLSFKKNNGESSYLIKKETKGTCPLLNSEGLCNIVINKGDEYLSSTCKTFPRIENRFENVKEFNLSCACPEVVNIISEMNEKISMDSKDYLSYIEDLGSLKIRETLVSIIQSEDINIEEKLMISYGMLLKILDSDDLSYEDLIELLDNYKLKSYIKDEVNKKSEYKNIEITESLGVLNLLFTDIIENYRNVSIFEDDLKDIYKFAKGVNKKSIVIEWKSFKKMFNDYEALNENFIASKILSNCINEDIEEMIISFEMIILEYLLSRYAVFLRYCVNREGSINLEWIQNYTVIFSRIIGNNSDSVIEFLLDRFENEILELDYLCFLTLS